jgi:hypothetical protein
VKRSRAAPVIAATLALSLTDCSIGAFCTEGEAGCVDPGCRDGVRSGDETDVDCGGSCGPCGVDRACAAPADCASGRCVNGLCCEAPCGLWASSFGSLKHDGATGVAIAQGGSIYVTGTFSGIVDFGGGPLASAGAADAFVLKLGAGGEHLWSARFGGALDDGPTSLALTAAGHPVLAITSADPGLDLGGGALAGSTNLNLYLIELDAGGEHVWSHVYDAYIEGAAIAVAPGGDLVLAASFHYGADLGSAGNLVSKGAMDVLLARLDPTGEPRWAKRYGDVWSDQAARVAVGADGAIYLAVRYSRSWSLGGAPLPDSKGEFSIGVVRLDGDGAHRWSRGWPNGTSHYATGLAVDDRGSVWVSGATRGVLDVGTGPLPAALGGSALVVRLDAESGDTLWARSFGEHTMAAHAVAPDGQGGVIVSGVFKGDADFGGGVALAAGTGQLFVARLDAAGSALWARGAEGVGLSTLVAATPVGDRLVLAGGYRGTLDVGAGPLPSAGEIDAFVAALSP